jgi:hypothetical protein
MACDFAGPTFRISLCYDRPSMRPIFVHPGAKHTTWKDLATEVQSLSNR